MLSKLIESNCESIIAIILSQYLCLNEYVQFETSNCNTRNQIYILNLINKKLFAFDILDRKNDKWFDNDYFINWLLLRQININKLILNGNKLIVDDYLKKIAYKIKLLIINNISININNIVFDNLEELIISCNTFNDYELFNIAKCKNIQSIMFQECDSMMDVKDFFVEDAKLLEKISIEMICKLPDENDEHDEYDKISNNFIIQLSHQCTNLTSIDLHRCTNLSNISIFELIKNCKITELSIYDNNKITDDLILKISNIINLKILKLSCCSNISETSIIEIGKKCINLEILQLIGCNISNKLINAITENCLKLINIIINQDESVYEISDIESLCILIKTHKIPKISLSISYKEENNLKLLTTLSKLKNLEILILSNQIMYQCYDFSLMRYKTRYLLKIIKKNSNLKFIDIDIKINLNYTLVEILKYFIKRIINCKIHIFGYTKKIYEFKIDKSPIILKNLNIKRIELTFK